MPCHRRGSRLKELLGCFVSCATVDEVNLWVSCRGARGRMDMKSAEVSAIVEGFTYGKIRKVLVSEGNNLSLGHEPCQLIFSSVAQLA